MPDSLIINARHRLRWHERLFSDATTAMLWGAWLWLWRPVLNLLAWVAGLGVSAAPALTKFLASQPVPSLENSVAALAGTSGTLLLWNLLPTRRASTLSTCSIHDYARHFELPADLILDQRDSKVCVVHHDASGRIVNIESHR
ncbi:MAG TPA: poly-beta-1,6-N-acetyl-D-glucosamine biosynthesis protein PgaD [Moraxellaceae bacterium]|nr:poly-beta-1,6-N-acetyl-D-glucosamine biosynthesis protein PgaD [Moraxellaceae bacterium]